MTTTGVPRTARQDLAGDDGNSLRMKGKASYSPPARRCSLKRFFGVRFEGSHNAGMTPRPPVAVSSLNNTSGEGDAP